ncbi:MAG: hypothetical protein LBJ15_19610 [Comamonas sp.]|jgi:hypothetical protein|uniref:hypothetical protein n=1 Tax=Comamonas sp. TaxID=34028 RepID=UPI002831F972|nr:hypothetical protein [Comamonas sp.]MDR0216183.1 hypothetical protein [Comamonas sp.]
MQEKKVWYEPHPVTPERKAELVAAGYRILDARFKPAGEESQGSEEAGDGSKEPETKRRGRKPAGEE